MSDLETRLREIEEREKAATLGPWEIGPVLPFLVSATGYADVIDGPVKSAIIDCDPTTQNDSEGREWRCDGTAEANADFIAHARDDIPFLVEQVRRLLDENARLRAENGSIREKANYYLSLLTEAEAGE